MKQAFVLIYCCLLALTACEKADSTGKNYPENLIGKWNYSQSFYSIGGPLIYTNTERLHQWIEFKADGSFSSNMPAFQDVAGYEVLDSVKVKFIRPASASSERFFVHFEPATKTLTVSSADHICIEGCGSKFKR
ncbi:MAG: hypothetical protein INR73_15480 [Williamsia sp.]|nr:hypothetical protein [Williamsia sp.]